ncbi:MAG: HEPN domain-containing protein [Bacteroidales bacterium]|nr:HEPN domain-containing protein [Bacteroidales bacterium]
MGLKDVDRETLVKMYWERCISALADADAAIESGRWNNAANRSYYAVFYAVSSLFVKDGYPIKSHRGAKNVLNKQYVITGKISVELAHFFAELETIRDEADYDVFFQATKEEVLDYRPKVNEFIAAIKKIINEE